MDAWHKHAPSPRPHTHRESRTALLRCDDGDGNGVRTRFVSARISHVAQT